MARKYLRGLQYVTGTNGRDIPIFMKLCYEFWGYCVNDYNPILTVTSATFSNPIQVTTATPHGLVNNQQVGVYGVQGNTAANGGWTVTVINQTQFNLNGSVGNANYVSGGLVTVPASMPATPTSAPAGFFEGASVLAVGTDGVTSAIGATLTAPSAPFTQSMVGKHVVTWQPGAFTSIASGSSGATLPQAVIAVNSTVGFPTSGTIFIATSAGVQQVTYNGTNANSFTGCSGGTGTILTNAAVTTLNSSTDNSIYRIIAVNGTTQLVVAPFTGGTPDISTLKPNLTSRSAVNYRVIDVVAASQLAVASGNYFVATMIGPGNINAGQSNSQFQFLLRGSSTPFGQLGIVASPTASWNGVSAFVSPGGASATITERNTSTSNNFTGTGANVVGVCTIIADLDFIFAHVKSSNSNAATGFYFFITTPLRLYTLAQDPNPMTAMVGANALYAGGDSLSRDSLANTLAMPGTDGVIRTQRLLSRNFSGDVNKPGSSNTLGDNWAIGPNLPTFLGFQERTGQIVIGDALIASDSAGQFYINRCKFRPFMFTTGGVPLYHLVGNNGEFIHVGNGILLPWDGSILPYNLLQQGA
jgi:hypothetical protein